MIYTRFGKKYVKIYVNNNMNQAKKDSENIADDPILIIANKIPRESPSQVQNLYKSVVNIFTVKADLKFTSTKIFHSKL